MVNSIVSGHPLGASLYGNKGETAQYDLHGYKEASQSSGMLSSRNPICRNFWEKFQIPKVKFQIPKVKKFYRKNRWMFEQDIIKVDSKRIARVV